MDEKLSTLTVIGATWESPQTTSSATVMSSVATLVSSDDEEIPTGPDHIETVTMQALSGSGMSSTSDNEVDENYTAMYEGIMYDMINNKTSTFR